MLSRWVTTSKQHTPALMYELTHVYLHMHIYVCIYNFINMTLHTFVNFCIHIHWGARRRRRATKVRPAQPGERDCTVVYMQLLLCVCACIHTWVRRLTLFIIWIHTRIHVFVHIRLHMHRIVCRAPVIMSMKFGARESPCESFRAPCYPPYAISLCLPPVLCLCL